MRITIPAEEAKKLVQSLLERYFPEIVIDFFSYSDWDGFNIDGTARVAVPPVDRPPIPPAPARAVDDDGFDIPF